MIQSLVGVERLSIQGNPGLRHVLGGLAADLRKPVGRRFGPGGGRNRLFHLGFATVN